MTKRICSNCGRAWYSAVAHETWTCQECGALIGPEHEVDLQGGADYGQAAGSGIRADKD